MSYGSSQVILKYLLKNVDLTYCMSCPEKVHFFFNKLMKICRCLKSTELQGSYSYSTAEWFSLPHGIPHIMTTTDRITNHKFLQMLRLDSLI